MLSLVMSPLRTYPDEKAHVVNDALQKNVPVLVADVIHDVAHASGSHSAVENQPEARHHAVAAVSVVSLVK